MGNIVIIVTLSHIENDVCLGALFYLTKYDLAKSTLEYCRKDTYLGIENCL